MNNEKTIPIKKRVVEFIGLDVSLQKVVNWDINKIPTLKLGESLDKKILDKDFIYGIP